MRNPMFVFDEGLTDLVFDYCRRRLAMDPVPLDYGGVGPLLHEELEGLMTPHGNDPERVLGLFADTLATAVVSCDSPRFLSFIPAAPTKAALLFDMVVSCSSLQGTSWLEAAGAVAAENQALRVLADLAGLPDTAAGCFVSGGSMGNLSALVVARDTAGLRRGGGPRPARPRIAVSEETHSSVSSALRIIGTEPLLVPTDDHRMTGEALEAALAAEGAADDTVAVVATAGSTNGGIVDDLAGIGAVCARRSLWFHVDAAYGGAALFAPSARERFAGIDRADSMIVDPHKWLFAPFDCAALLYREPELARAVHAQRASYLEITHDERSFNPSDYAFHLTRRARGLPLWFSLAVHGTDAYRDAVEAVLAIARTAAGTIRALPYLELVREPELSVVLFRRLGWERADYEAWSRRLLAEQIGFVTPTTWEGRPVARMAFLHPETTPAIVEEILATMAP
ncbi:MAG TPA: aminotransferase class I/II-fold pyridoxal phosphate-dependent enzyme [Acidimicrobiales bacterium]|nr:aminotransferase class I/II-fold pyridoxal phosphate-dependent enzyme [Acidimicrobiales bacterium]